MTAQHDDHRPGAPAGDLSIDAPDMPEPQVREVTAHSIPGGVGLLLTVVGVFAGVGLAIVGGVTGAGGNNAVGVPLLILGV
ncbi:SPFH domain-containing protein, partial [Streptomyces sp. SID7499]|nr:SPFH domain-containing protein [Streptomyces sp. SID7499]